MPFDGVDFQARPERPNRSNPGERVVSLLVLALAFCLLVMPISMAALVDIVRYLQGG